MAALIRLYEPVGPAAPLTAKPRDPPYQSVLFVVGDCHDCGTGIFGQGNRTLCPKCAKQRRKERDLIRGKSFRSRAKHHNVVEIDTGLHWSRLLEEDGPLCGICLYPVEINAVWPDPCHPCTDHIVPISKGGSHTRSNVQLAHNGCNTRKGQSTQGRYRDLGGGVRSADVPVSWVRWTCETHGVTRADRLPRVAL